MSLFFGNLRSSTQKLSSSVGGGPSSSQKEPRTPGPQEDTATSSLKRTPKTGDRTDEESERVKVVLRLRPALNKEEGGALKILDEEGYVRLLRPDSAVQQSEFKFDKVLGPDASQHDVYMAGVRDVVGDVMQGYNGTVMAYGQTGAGKTHTLGNTEPSSIGMIPRCVAEIFKQASADPFHNYTVSMSYIQIYMELIQDLLYPESENLLIREDANNGVYLAGAHEAPVASLEECLHYLELGERNRVFAFTHLNAHSSRSHAVVMVTVVKSRKYLTNQEKAEVKKAEKEGVVSQKVKVGKLYLVDLAGSERLKKSRSVGVRATEAKSINLSLTTLGMCISARANDDRHVPFRDSKLTRLLQESLGGNAKTTLIICVADAKEHVDETLQSLQFASRAMCVKNKPVINERVDYRMLHAELVANMDSQQDKSHELEVAILRTEEERDSLKAALEHEKEHYEAIIKALRAENAERVATVSNQVKGLREELGAEQSAKGQLETRIRDMEEDNAQMAQVHHKQVEALNTQIKDLLSSQAAQAAANRRDAEAAAAELADLRQQLATSQARGDALQDENTQLKSQIHDLKALLGTVQTSLAYLETAMNSVVHDSPDSGVLIAKVPSVASGCFSEPSLPGTGKNLVAATEDDHTPADPHSSLTPQSHTSHQDAAMTSLPPPHITMPSTHAKASVFSISDALSATPNSPDGQPYCTHITNPLARSTDLASVTSTENSFDHFNDDSHEFPNNGSSIKPMSSVKHTAKPPVTYSGKMSATARAALMKKYSSSKKFTVAVDESAAASNGVETPLTEEPTLEQMIPVQLQALGSLMPQVANVVSSLQADNEKHLGTIATLEQHISQGTAQCELLSSNLETTRQQLTDACHKLDNACQQLSQGQDRIAQFEAEIEQLQSRITTLDQQLAARDADIVDLKCQLKQEQEARRQLERLQNRVLNARQELHQEQVGLRQRIRAVCTIQRAFRQWRAAKDAQIRRAQESAAAAQLGASMVLESMTNIREAVEALLVSFVGTKKELDARAQLAQRIASAAPVLQQARTSSLISNASYQFPNSNNKTPSMMASPTRKATAGSSTYSYGNSQAGLPVQPMTWTGPMTRPRILSLPMIPLPSFTPAAAGPGLASHASEPTPADAGFASHVSAPVVKQPMSQIVAVSVPIKAQHPPSKMQTSPNVFKPMSASSQVSLTSNYTNNNSSCSNTCQTSPGAVIA